MSKNKIRNTNYLIIRSTIIDKVELPNKLLKKHQTSQLVSRIKQKLKLLWIEILYWKRKLEKNLKPLMKIKMDLSNLMKYKNFFKILSLKLIQILWFQKKL